MSAGARCLGIALVAMALAGCFKQRITEDDLRDVAGIAIQTTDMEVAPDRLTVHCRLENQTERPAVSIVFTVEALAEDGAVVAVNPLGNVLDLLPGDSREVAVPVPMPPGATTPHETRAKVNLVRWGH